MRIRGREVPLVVSLFMWLAVWEVVGQSELVFVVPAFSDVARAVFDLFSLRSFGNDVLVTLRSFGIGMSITLGVGLPIGFLMGRFHRVDELLGMWVNLLMSAPKTALVPVIMPLFGIGHKTVVFAVVLFSLWVVILDTRAGVRNVNESLLEMARSFGAKRSDMYSKVILWSALPEILTGLRLAVIRGVRGAVIGQMMLSTLGLGKLFVTYSRSFLMARFFAVLVIVLLFAWSLSELVGRLEKRVEHFARCR